MKISFQATLLLLLASLFHRTAFAEDHYIMYDPSCMDRLEYAYGFTPDDQHYVKYHIKINATEVIVLEIGLESESPTQSYLNSSTVGCSDEVLNSELADRIRNNLDRVFMVRQKGNQYQISRVNMASYFRRDDRGVVYDSWQFSFKHSGSLNPGDVLTDDPAKMLKVTYQGTTEYKCTDAYRFRMEFSNSSNYRDLFFLPGVGIVEERPNSGSSGDVYQLKNYNDTPFDTYLEKVCQQGAGNLSSNFLPGANSFTGNSTNNSGANSTQYHEVEKGETAFSISRKYDVSLDELRAWNPEIKNASLVKVGDRVRVSPPNGMASSPPASPQNGGFSWTGTSSGNAGANDSYNSANNFPDNMTAKGQQVFAWDTTNGKHTVRPGETVALLALKYGYTEQRFRNMNNLGPNDIVKIGQEVKTTDCSSSSGGMSGSTDAGSVPGSTNLFNTNSSANQWSSSNYQNNNSVTTSNNSNQNNSSSNTTQQSLPSSSTLPTYNNPTENNNGLGTALSPRSPNNTMPGPGTAANAPSSASSSSFEPYGTNGPDFSSLPSPSTDNNTNYYHSESNTSGRGYYPNTDSAVRSPENTLPTYNDSRSIPDSQPSSQGTSSGFGTPIPRNNGTIPNTNRNEAVTTGNSDPFSSSSYYSPDDNRNSPANTSQTVHIVREGDTLESIARKYNTTTERLRQVNNLDRTEVLIPYQKLSIN